MSETIADKLVQIAENEVKLYEKTFGKGYRQGKTDGYDEAMSERKTEVSKSVTITENGTRTITPNSRETFSSVEVTVDVPIPDGYIQPAGTMDITENGEYSVAKYEKVNVNVKGGGGGGMDTDAFWDMYQKNGERFNYAYAFNEWYKCKELDLFHPKYDIKPTGSCNNMFYQFNYGSSIGDEIDLPTELEKDGVALDFSGVTGTVETAFAFAMVSRLGVLDFRNTKESLTGMFAGCASLKTIDMLGINENSTFPKAFLQCSALENLTIEGTIGQTGLNFNASKRLTRDSIMSVINHLKDYSGTSGTTYKVTFGSTNLAKLTDAEKAIATGKGWTLA